MRQIALGLTSFLQDFAMRYGAESWKEFAKDDPIGAWRNDFLVLMSDPNVVVFFNLKAVDVWGGVTRGSSGRGGPTDWELFQIHQNPAWWPRIRWIEDDSLKPNPFE